MPDFSTKPCFCLAWYVLRSYSARGLYTPEQATVAKGRVSSGERAEPAAAPSHRTGQRAAPGHARGSSHEPARRSTSWADEDGGASPAELELSDDDASGGEQPYLSPSALRDSFDAALRRAREGPDTWTAVEEGPSRAGAETSAAGSGKPRVVRKGSKNGKVTSHRRGTYFGTYTPSQAAAVQSKKRVHASGQPRTAPAPPPPPPSRSSAPSRPRSTRGLRGGGGAAGAGSAHNTRDARLPAKSESSGVGPTRRAKPGSSVRRGTYFGSFPAKAPAPASTMDDAGGIDEEVAYAPVPMYHAPPLTTAHTESAAAAAAGADGEGTNGSTAAHRRRERPASAPRRQVSSTRRGTYWGMYTPEQAAAMHSGEA